MSAGHSMRSVLTADPASQSSIKEDNSQPANTCGGGSVSTQSECSNGERNENCTYECSLLSDPPAGYSSSCEFIEENCDGEYELLNYLQFMECHLGSSLRVCIQKLMK